MNKQGVPEINDRYAMIFELVRQIPEGRVSTYGILAESLGFHAGARLVGYALNHSFGVDPPVPAHRVVNRNGLLTGRAHFDPPEQMQALLESEGICIRDHQVQNFEALCWDPRRDWEEPISD